MTGPAHEKGTRPGHKARTDPLGPKHAKEVGRVDVVETPFDVQKKSTDYPLVHPEGPDFVG